MPEKKKILIVEDEHSLLNALTSKFGRENFDVLQAVDGQEGLKLALGEHPDLILLDIVMPKMDGLTMLEELRKNEWGKHIPVIILSNLGDAEKVAQGASKGVHDYLVKSNWHIDDVMKKVKDRLHL